jgi:hypothetical protein
MQPDQQLDLDNPRTIPEIIFTTLRVLLRYAPLLLGLAAIVVVPYEVVIILVAKTGDLGASTRGTERKLLILLAVQVLIVQPLLASFQAYALLMIGKRERPGFVEILRRSAPVLLNVIAAEIIAGIVITIGFFLFLIPGIYMLVRYTVVAQSAAIERLDWPTALRRSMDLSHANWWRIFGVMLLGGIVNATVQSIGGALVSSGVNPGSVIVGLICALLTLTFSSLLSAVLYFDLRARHDAPTDYNTGV